MFYSARRMSVHDNFFLATFTHVQDFVAFSHTAEDPDSVSCHHWEYFVWFK